MKKVLFSVLLGTFALSTMAHNANEAASDTIEGFRFTTVDSLAITPVKDQNRSGTCWSFSTIGFLESELLRMGKGEYDLSEMFVVHHTMVDRAEYVVRMYGNAQFAPGGSAYDVIYCLKNYGMVPQEAMPGIQYGSSPADTLPVHTELDAVAGGVVDAVANSGLKKLTPVWKKALTAVYDTYLGACPETFTYNGKEYTAKSFAESLGLKAEDYVELTSFSHHPFYELIPVEIPDNWDHAMMYNLPLDEFMAVIDNAINTGYTVTWDGDVSEPGYAFQHHVAVNTDEDLRKAQTLTAKAVEKPVTQQSRKATFENFTTTDDHLEHIVGIAKDQDGVKYYKVKNSWGTQRNGTGYHYFSEEYVKGKTISILVHKNSIPKDLRSKLGIK